MSIFLPNPKENGKNAEMHDRESSVINTHNVTCPKCRDDDALTVKMSEEYDLETDGEYYSRERMEPEETDPCRCRRCGWTGTYGSAVDAYLYGVPEFIRRLDWRKVAKQLGNFREANNGEMVQLLESMLDFAENEIEDTSAYHAVMDGEDEDEDEDGEDDEDDDSASDADKSEEEPNWL